MIKFLIFTALLNPEFSESAYIKSEFSELQKTYRKRRGKSSKGRRRGGKGLR